MTRLALAPQQANQLAGLQAAPCEAGAGSNRFQCAARLYRCDRTHWRRNLCSWPSWYDTRTRRRALGLQTGQNRGNGNTLCVHHHDALHTLKHTFLHARGSQPRARGDTTEHDIWSCTVCSCRPLLVQARLHNAYLPMMPTAEAVAKSGFQNALRRCDGLLVAPDEDGNALQKRHCPHCICITAAEHVRAYHRNGCAHHKIARDPHIIQSSMAIPCSSSPAQARVATSCTMRPASRCASSQSAGSYFTAIRSRHGA